ncbi:hypothetical protein AMTR_s00048p00148250 [Amborella trichopoda]|uniref:Uncharacterized protein n=2 Tax=Amborella trichopoda TaxID=13333 RepID=U5CZJ6_AMBTC|nr:hypothetical protein AMTR_s00048p00148250 [Amborella trichopoda]
MEAMDAEATPSKCPDLAENMERANRSYREYAGVEEKASKREMVTWYAYNLFSHFIPAVLIPIVFSLMVGQMLPKPSVDGDLQSLHCSVKETEL